MYQASTIFIDYILQAAHMYLEDGIFHNIPYLHENGIFSSPHYLNLQWIATAVHPIAKTKLLKFSDISN